MLISPLTRHAECNFLDKYDTEFGQIMALDCAKHDQAYKTASFRAKNGAPRGARIPVEMEWIEAAWTVSRWRAVFYGAFLLGLGWVLWYDLDDGPKRAWKWVSKTFSVSS